MINNALSYGATLAKHFYYDGSQVKKIYYGDVLVYDVPLSTPSNIQLSANKLSFSTVKHATEYAVYVTTPPDTTITELGTTAHLYEVNGKLMTVYNAEPYEVRQTTLRLL